MEYGEDLPPVKKASADCAPLSFRVSTEEDTVPSLLTALPTELVAEVVRWLPRNGANALRCCGRYWRDLIDSVPQLWRQLDLTGAALAMEYRPPEDSLAAIACQARFKHLKVLSLPWGTSLATLVGFLSVVRPRLEELSGSRLRVQALNAANVRDGLAHLRVLRIGFTTGEERPSVAASVFGGLPLLGVLTVECDSFAIVAAIASRCNVLRSLTVVFREPPNDWDDPWDNVDALGQCTALTTLCLSMHHVLFIPPDLLSHLRSLQHLRSLTLRNCSTSTTTGFEALSLMTGLEDLDVAGWARDYGWPYEPVPLRALETLSRLRRLSLDIGLAAPADLGAGLASVLARLTQLRVFHHQSDKLWELFAVAGSCELRELTAHVHSKTAFARVVRGLTRSPALQRFECRFLHLNGATKAYVVSRACFEELQRVPYAVLCTRAPLLMPIEESAVQDLPADPDHEAFPYCKRIATRSSSELLVRMTADAGLVCMAAEPSVCLEILPRKKRRLTDGGGLMCMTAEPSVCLNILPREECEDEH